MCLACGDHGAADFLLNVVLFAPLGAVLMRSAPGKTAYVILFGALLSASIEVAQLYIPGRDASLGDVVANTLGTAAGALAVGRANLQAPRAGTACLVAALVCFATGSLLTPTYPRSQYFGLWTPNLAHLGWYRGRVRAATLSSIPVITGPIRESPRVREALLADSGYTLAVRALAGPEPSRLAPLFAIFDDRRRDIILVGPDRDDLVLRVHTRAADWRFDRPDLRAAHALRDVRPSDSLSVSVSKHRSGGGYEIGINGRVYRRVGYEIGDGWALLLYPETVAPLKAVLGVIWVAGLFFPVGFWIRGKRDAWVAVGGVTVSLLGAPLLTPLLPTPVSQWVAAALGLAAGWGLHLTTSGERAPVPVPLAADNTSTSLPTQRSMRE